MRQRPWWLPSVFGSLPDLEPRLFTLLGLVSLALFFESYDLSMLTSALKHIAEDLGMAEQDLGGYLGTIRLGALPALAIVPLADRLGRRRLLLGSLIGVSILTAATAFARDPETFVALQMATRIFMVIGTSVAIVIVTPACLAVAVGLFLMPVYMMLLTALKEPAAIGLDTAWQLPHRWNWTSFAQAWTSFLPKLRNSLVLTVTASAASAILGSLNGYVFAKWPFPGSRIVFAFILFGMFIPYQAVLIPPFGFVKSIGVPAGKTWLKW